MGDALIEFARCLRPAALVIAHHATKGTAREFGRVPELEDLAGAGIAEAAGAWWLLGRNQPYDFDGVHDLSVRFGGRDEQGGAYRIRFDERAWRFDFQPIDEYRAQSRSADINEREEQKAREAALRVQRDTAAVLNGACHINGQRATRNKFCELSGLSGSRFNAAWASLLRDGSVREDGQIKAANGQECPAFQVSYAS